MNARIFFITFFCLILNFGFSYARVAPPTSNPSQRNNQQQKPVSIQDKQIQEFLRMKKRQETLKLLEKYNETYPKRFETLLLISYPFTTILTFLSVQVYGLLNAGDSGFQMNRTHGATVIIGSAFLSLAVAYKGYRDFKKRKEKIKKSLLNTRLSFLHQEETSQEYFSRNKFPRLPAANNTLSKKSFYFSLYLGRYSF